MQKSVFHKTQLRHMITLNEAFFPQHPQPIRQFVDACKLICMSLMSHAIAEHYQIVHVHVGFALHTRMMSCLVARTHHAQHEQEHQSHCIAAFDAHFSSPASKTLLDAIKM